MKVPYAAPSYGQREIDAVVGVLNNPAQIVAGPKVEAFEDRVCALFGKRHGLMVNSGSSANLLALASLELEPGAEVITPALTFATTVAPILQLGLVPVLVDVDPATFVVTPEAVRAAITTQTGALMIPLLLGNVPDMFGLAELGLPIIEDSCDTLGATWAGRPTGYYSDISTTSFYASHVITAAGGGGMVCFHEGRREHKARLLAHWGRASSLYGHGRASEDIGLRYSHRIDGEPYDAKFLFVEVGYNMQPLELQAAFGLEQLDRLAGFTALRARHWQTLYDFFAQFPHLFTLPEVLPEAGPNWLAFPIRVRPDAPFTRMEVARYLEGRGIQTRPIMTGNILRQPAFEALGRGEFLGADAVMREGLLLGCHHALTDDQIAFVMMAVEAFVRNQRMAA